MKTNRRDDMDRTSLGLFQSVADQQNRIKTRVLNRLWLWPSHCLFIQLASASYYRQMPYPAVVEACLSGLFIFFLRLFSSSGGRWCGDKHFWSLNIPIRAPALVYVCYLSDGMVSLNSEVELCTQLLTHRSDVCIHNTCNVAITGAVHML